MGTLKHNWLEYNLVQLLWKNVQQLQVVPVVKNPPAIAGETRDTGSIPGLGKSPEGENGNPLQYSCLENAADRGA